MAATMTPPTAAVHAGPEPDIPPTIMATRMVITARAPRPRADDGLREPEQPRGDPGPVEDGAGQDEHRNGQKRILGDPGIDIGRKGHDAELPQGNDQGPGQTQGGGDGHAGKHQDKEGAEENIDRDRLDLLPPRADQHPDGAAEDRQGNKRQPYGVDPGGHAEARRCDLVAVFIPGHPGPEDRQQEEQ